MTGRNFLTDNEKARWPEYSRYLDHVGPEAHAIGEFIEWLRSSSDYTLATWVGEAPFESLVVVFKSEEQLLCEFYGIDYDQYRREREEATEEALEQQRRLNEQRE